MTKYDIGITISDHANTTFLKYLNWFGQKIV